jgi:hypothetical protein
MKVFHANRALLSAMMLACFALLVVFPGPAAAHAPREVKLTYDTSTQTLTAAVTHSPFASFHYVKKVEVMKNGKPAAVQEYSSQSAETFTYSVKVEAAPGDVLEVTASCSLFGSKTEKLTVPPAAAK